MNAKQMENIELMEQVEAEALQVLLRRMKAHNDNHPKDRVVNIPNQDTTKEALLTLSSIGRLKQSQSAREATQLMVLRTLTKDEKTFQRYLAVSLPHLNPVKMIEAVQ